MTPVGLALDSTRDAARPVGNTILSGRVGTSETTKISPKISVLMSRKQEKRNRTLVLHNSGQPTLQQTISYALASILLAKSLHTVTNPIKLPR